jgi:polyhydroxyalkanoate synthesis regulator phasin
VVAPRTFPTKIIQTTGERIPIAGTAGVRRAQQEQRINAVRNVLREYEADDYAKLSENVLKDLATKRSADISKYSQAKNEVIDRLSEKGMVPLDNANKAIDEQITSLARRKSPAADEAIERLQEIKTNLQNRDLFQLEAYRRDELSKVFMDDPVRPLSPAAREVGEQALRAVYDPVRQDMGAFIRQTGERRDFEKWMIANKRLAETAGDMKNASLKTVLLKE